ncbi:hypothetical protein [Pelosinus baikalensis]|uniref:Uncharacterized protein n=1 Tax=Pelosinus baikalensis TaxID=2892015 RepID=A0ABS8HNC4_9FIRM|nr:hypothetical protein [Pelosinus baikalensis]MCC5464644.1 hypothetical protein [Pelosinus baikalensis]
MGARKIYISAHSSEESQAFYKVIGCVEAVEINKQLLDAEGCVYFTAKGALKRGYKVSTIQDGIVLLAEKKWNSLLKKYKKNGITLLLSKEFDEKIS